MNPIYVDLERLERGTRPEFIVSRSPDVDDLPAAITPSGHIVSCWRPTDEERRQLAEGADIYLFVVHCGMPLQPVCLVVG